MAEKLEDDDFERAPEQPDDGESLPDLDAEEEKGVEELEDSKEEEKDEAAAAAREEEEKREAEERKLKEQEEADEAQALLAESQAAQEQEEIVSSRMRADFIDNRARSVLEQDYLAPLKAGGLWRSKALTKDKMEALGIP